MNEVNIDDFKNDYTVMHETLQSCLVKAAHILQAELTKNQMDAFEKREYLKEMVSELSSTLRDVREL